MFPCLARICLCGHEVSRNCLDNPGGKSGFRQSGVIGPGVYEREYLLLILWKQRRVRKLQKGSLILCGDFNIAPDNHLDTSKGKLH